MRGLRARFGERTTATASCRRSAAACLGPLGPFFRGEPAPTAIAAVVLLGRPKTSDAMASMGTIAMRGRASLRGFPASDLRARDKQRAPRSYGPVKNIKE